MIKHLFDDGSVGYEYETGDLVEFTSNGYGRWCDPKKGDWGKVIRMYVDRKFPTHWSTRTMDVQLAGYCYKKDSFIQCATSVFPWEVRPKVMAGSLVVKRRALDPDSGGSSPSPPDNGRMFNEVLSV